MYHSLDVEIAKEVGANSALIFNHFLHWITKNKANGDNFYEGRYWTYASNKSLEDLFPYFTTAQIRTAIKNLKDKDLILIGNFNKSSYDRTTWYSLTDYAESILQNAQIDFTRKANANGENNKCICEKSQMEVGKITNGFVENDKCICEKSQMDLLKITNGFVENNKPIPNISKDISKDISINKDINNSFHSLSISKESKEESQSISNWKAKEKDMSDVATTTCPNENDKQNVYSQLQNSYNTICTSLPRCTLISDKRKKAINAILGQFSMEQVTEALKKVQASDFLSGRSGAWQCSFDWLMITGNMLKVIEGNYDNKKNSRSDLGEREFTLTSREAKLSTDREFVLR